MIARPGRLVRAALAASAALVAGCAASHPRPFSEPIPPFREGDRFAVVGDLQRTSVLEFWRESNDPERAMIVGAIAAARPAFLVIAGDLVFDGSSEAEWDAFDHLVAPLHRAKIPTIAALGNHEYWGGFGDTPGFFSRFPLVALRHFYDVAWGPLRIVVLDSNFDELPPGVWDRQRRWYEAKLADFDRDPEVRGVIVIAHHPPFTNSTVTGDELRVQETFVPPFQRAVKATAMISGHVHAYERFERGGKLFLVSGGGGGPRAALATGARRRHADDRVVGPALRDFHFTLFAPTAAGVEATVMGLAKGGKLVAPIDRFLLPWPAPSADRKEAR